MRRAAAALALMLALPALAHGAYGVEGDGRPTTERREVGAFDAVELDTSADVSVRVGGAPSVAVTIDGNLQPYLRTEVHDGTLVIVSGRPFHARSDARVEVTVPALRRFELAGSGDVAIDGGAGPLRIAIAGSGDLRWTGEATELRTDIAGSGNVRLAGRADRLEVAVRGSGDVDAATLRAKDVTAKVEGNGDVDVNVDGGSLTASVSGAGDIHWRGHAKVESAVVTGSGEIARKE